MTPYYDDGNGIVIYHGDCREVLPGLAPESVSLVLTDPPYGVAERTDRGSKGRGAPFGGRSARGAWAFAHAFPPVYGDDEPFDPSHLLRFKRLVLWGGNHYADRLPPSASWIVWDKLGGLSSAKRLVGLDDNADVEMAWTNLGGPARLVPHRWKGLLRDSEKGEPRVHPTQKPVPLMAFVISWRTDPGDLILDPYMGSGPVLRAAKDLGRKAIGIEIEEKYCEIAAKRLGQEVLAL